MINRPIIEQPELNERRAYVQSQQLDAVDQDIRTLGDPETAPYAPKQLPVYTSSSRPAAGGDWRYRTILVKDVGSPSQVQICVESSTGGGYEWLDVERVIARSARLDSMGIWVGSSPPVSPITFAAWAAGTAGYWGWIYTP